MPWPFSSPKGFSSIRELAPDGLFDIHCHLLPSVDDGSGSWEESISMLDALAVLGYRKVAATPHFESRSRGLGAAGLAQLVDDLVLKRGDRLPEVISGAEILFDDSFFQEEQRGNLPTLGAARTYLVELGFFPGSVPIGVEDTLFRVKVRGANLILAHPERCPDLADNPNRLDSIRRSGVLLQLNLLSLAGKYGRDVKRKAFSLLERGSADLFATDLHGEDDLDALEQALEELFEWDEAELVRLVSNNPRLVLEGRPEEVLRHE